MKKCSFWKVSSHFQMKYTKKNKFKTFFHVHFNYCLIIFYFILFCSYFVSYFTLSLNKSNNIRLRCLNVLSWCKNSDIGEVNIALL